MGHRIISVDPDVMEEMASLAGNADAELDACLALLAALTAHNNWNCKERDAICDGISALKQNAGKLKENMELFASSLRQIADRFRAFDTALPRRSQSAESAFGQTVSSFLNGELAVSRDPGRVAGQTAERISSELLTSDRLENYTIGNLLEPLQVCEYAAFAPALPSGGAQALGTAEQEEKINAILQSFFRGE